MRFQQNHTVMNLFYCADISGSTGQLSADESKHCIKVLRHRRGDHIHLTDGKGSICEAMIVSADPGSCTCEIIQRTTVNSSLFCEIHIAIAPTKNINRFEWFLEKSVEMGISKITPLICQRSERRTLKTERLHKLIISSMKQSFSPFLPALNEPDGFSSFLNAATKLNATKFIGHCNNSGRKLVKDTYIKGSDVIFLIGPEGDFTPDEIDMAIQHSFIPVKLGNNRLRTETAGLVACHTIHLLND